MVSHSVRTLLAFALLTSSAWGQSSSIPLLDSRPGAAYTLYLNFGGFDYTGTWAGLTPGSTPAYTVDADPNFTNAELTQIREIWSRAAEKYAAFNVNVTTVDPAAAAGQAGSDTQRQAYYDSQPRMMHQVIGGDGSWYGDPDTVGVSYRSVAASFTTGGRHTNWTFAANYVDDGVPYLSGIGETVAHENGHALRLEHQSLWSGTVKLSEYDPGDAARAPIMGYSDDAARGLWRRGTDTDRNTQNDPAELLRNTGIAGDGVAGYLDSGIGHTRGTATPLPVQGTGIDFTAAKGVITPNSADPNPLGEQNYTKDYFTFTVADGTADLSVSLHSGRSTLTPGVADPGATLDATLRLLDADGFVLVESNQSTFLESIVRSELGAGTYYLEIASAGADERYFDMGSYFLTGSLAFTPVPEPAAVLAVAGLTLFGVSRVGRFWRRGRAASAGCAA